MEGQQDHRTIAPIEELSFDISEDTHDASQEEDLEFNVFGGRLAKQVGASLSGDREEEEQRAAQRRDDMRMQNAAKPHDWECELVELPFDQRVEKTMACLRRRESFRKILYGLLKFCEQERTYDEIDAHVRCYPESEANRQSSRRYVFFLRRTGALEEVEYDANGDAVTDDVRAEKRAAGMAEEAIEDLGVEQRVMTTEVGRKAIRLDDPGLRLCDLLVEKESRLSTYRRLLEFCAIPRQLEEIASFLADDPGLEIDHGTGVAGMQPNAYISKLDQAGGLVWNDGWVATEEGLKSIAAL
jgi:hypothetical protein